MIEESNASAGFSTVEILVAFAVLSLGLGLAVQSVSQASVSLRRADEAGREVILLRKVMAEELPRLIHVYTGKAIEAAGPSWRIALQPLSDQEPQRAIQATIEISPGEGASSIRAYTTVLPFPLRDRRGAFPAAGVR